MIDRTVALDVVQRSPAAVARHDKQAWLDLFADEFVVEDPYGGRPVRDRVALDRFWDTYIATRQIEFELEQPDIVVGADVIRDVTIVIRDDAGVELRTPAHLRYVLVSGSGVPGLFNRTRAAQPHVARLAAHWEVAPVLRQLAGLDPARLRSMAGTTVRMMRYQRVSGTAGFVRAMGSVGARGKAAVRELVDAAKQGDAGAQRLLGGRVSELRKLIAAGDTVSASCRIDDATGVLFARVVGSTVRQVDLFF